MSRWIRLSNGLGRNARVRMEPPSQTPRVTHCTVDGRIVTSERFIKGHAQTTFAALQRSGASHAEIVQALLDGDPEIDLEATGRRVGSADRVFLDPDGALLYATAQVEVQYDARGLEIERREPMVTPANIDAEAPLVWTGKFVPRQEAVCRFSITRQYRLRHVDGLTFDFLFCMAKELEQAGSLALVGTGSRGKDPLILERNGLPYRGFLEGRTLGDKYLLVLHLTNLELKTQEGVVA